MKLNLLSAVAVAGVVALGFAGPASAQSTTEQAPDALTTTAGSENMKLRHERHPELSSAMARDRSAMALGDSVSDPSVDAIAHGRSQFTPRASETAPGRTN